MLVEGLLNIIIGAVNFMLNLLPTINFGFLENISWVLGQVTLFTQYAGYFVPMTDFMLVLTGVILIQNFQIMLFFINWIIRRIADIIP
jgi:hypothetical protein